MPSTATSSTADTASAPSSGAGTEQRERRAVTAVIVVAVLLVWLISTSWRPWNLFDRAGFSADFYDEQARSFLRGRLAVRPEVAGIEGFLVDGATYLYYGPFLAVVRLPFALFGDLFTGRLVRLSMLVAVVVLGRWTARLARSARRTVGVAGDAVWPTVALVGATLFSPVLFVGGWVSVYHETEIWAMALAVVSTTLVLEWAADGFRDRHRLLWAVAAIAATTLTRAPIGLGVATGLGVLGLGLAWRSRDRAGRDGWLPVAGAVSPLVAHAVVNWAKFGTLFSVPGDRQLLSLRDPVRAAFFEETGGSFFDARFLPTTLVQYLRPDTIRFERLVPGIRFGPLAENRGSLDVETVTPASSLPVSATALLALAVIGVAWLIARRGRGRRTWLVMVAGGVAGAVPTFLIGFIANRYLIDMLPPLVTAAAVGTWVLADRVGDRPLPRAWAIAGTAVLVWGAWVNVALATWTAELKSPGFTELRSDVDAALFGGGDVGTIVAVDTRTPVPRDGVVGLALGCGGTYIAEQGSWVALERALGTYEVRGTVDDTFLAEPSPVRIAETDAWTLDLAALDVGGLAFVYATPTDPAASVVATDRTTPFDFRVVVDPVTSESFVEIDDEVSFLPGTAVDSVTADGIAPGSAPRVASPLCTTLAGRR